MNTEPTETHDRGAQEDTEKPDVGSLFAPPRSEVVSLETLRRNDLDRGGGKGANLGELISVGLPVPPGFCVTTAAYRRVVAETGLDEAIDEALRTSEMKISPPPMPRQRASARSSRTCRCRTTWPRRSWPPTAL